ncbi:conserved hypothetical protein, partial [delta proteobacterium NaphS2]
AGIELLEVDISTSILQMKTGFLIFVCSPTMCGSVC